MNTRLSFLIIGFFGLIFHACVPPDYGKKQYEGITLDFNDKNIQSIINLQENESRDSILMFFKSDNPTYRYLAAMAFASLKDKKGFDSLATKLNDPFTEVRIAAAYALGQLGDTRAEDLLLKAYQRNDTIGKFAQFNATILEAVGKCGTIKQLNNLCNIRSFNPTDSILIQGQAFGIYRFGTRDSFNDISIKKMVSFVEDKTMFSSVRLTAAYYLSRLKTKYDTTITNPLSKLAMSEPDPNIRMSLVKALGKAYGGQYVAPNMESIFRLEKDYRVKVNIINALSDFDYALIQPLAQLALRDRNIHVANTAATLFLKKGNESDAGYYRIVSEDESLPRSVRNTLKAAALKYLRFYPKIRDSLNIALQNQYKNAQNPYEKAQLLRGLAAFDWNFDFIKNEGLNLQNTPIVKTAAAEAIAEISASPTFYQTFKGNSIGIKRQIKTILFQFIRTGDVGITAVAAEALRNPSGQYNKKLMRDSLTIMYNVLQHFKLPEQVEAYESLRETMNWIADTTAFLKQNQNAPKSIDWSIITKLTPSSIAVIKTGKGEIKMNFMPNTAPISVVNFITLARAGFFNGKIFHRVVPNFVVQTGCPRGDGYGSLDYTISSELGMVHYDTEGYVGMASAGNHTECSQWFITHSPTLHLDPNYTIFGKITEGMNVVHQLEVGDAVENVYIQ
jgi:cyclophilin family peptidyl-prolyl cis-trans isomerase/HEAT repeat protein